MFSRINFLPLIVILLLVGGIKSGVSYSRSQQEPRPSQQPDLGQKPELPSNKGPKTEMPTVQPGPSPEKATSITVRPEPVAAASPLPTATPGFMSMSHPERPPSFEAHVYSRNDFLQTVRDSNKTFIVAHGISERIDQFTAVRAYYEFVPVFISDKREPQNLTSQELISILKGDITDWKQLNSTAGRITLYLHGGVLQQKVFGKFLETIGLTTDDLQKTNKVYGADYDSLEKLASKDPDAIVIGLKKPKPDNLKTVSINGVSILDYRQMQNYPLRIPVTIYRKDTFQDLKLYRKRIEGLDESNKLEQYFEKQIKRDSRQ
jgi:hypothetical protein